MSTREIIHVCIVLAGIGQLGLCAGSLAIPKVLGWREQTAAMQPLTRQIFWTYAGYIWTINLCFGAVSAFAPELLIDGSPLAVAVCAFIFLYWGARVVIQLAYFDTSGLPTTLGHRLAKWGLEGLFVFLAGVYGAATLFSLGLLPS